MGKPDNSQFGNQFGNHLGPKARPFCMGTAARPIPRSTLIRHPAGMHLVVLPESGGALLSWPDGRAVRIRSGASTFPALHVFRSRLSQEEGGVSSGMRGRHELDPLAVAVEGAIPECAGSTRPTTAVHKSGGTISQCRRATDR